MEKKVKTEILVKLAEILLKNNNFQFSERALNIYKVQQLVLSLDHHMQFFLWLPLRKKF